MPDEKNEEKGNPERFVYSEGELQLVEENGSLTRIGKVPAAAIMVSVPTYDKLFQALPMPPIEWTTAERIRWLRLAASMFDVLYDRPDTLVTIEIKTVVEGSDGETG